MRTRAWAFSAVVVVAGCGAPPESDGDGELVDEVEQGVKVCADGEVLEGIDVSAYQPNVDWNKVKGSGRAFAIIKATEATGYVNKYFAQDWVGVAAVGMVRGAYHYFHPDIDPIAQANHMLDIMGPLGPYDLPPTIDVEESGGLQPAAIQNSVFKFVERVHEVSGKKPIVYTSPYFWNSVVGAPPGIEEKAHLWVANWGVECPDVPKGWSDWPLWQYSSTGSVPGVSGNCDLDRFNGNWAQLLAFAAGGAPGLAQITGNGAMTMMNWPKSGHAEIFVRAKNGDLVHTWSKGTSDDWNDFHIIDTGAECGLAGAFWPTKGYGEVFSPKADGSTQHTELIIGDGWSDLQDFGGSGLSQLSTLAWPDGHIEVFALGDDGAIWHRFWNQGAGAWSEWESMGGDMAIGPTAILWGDGHAELFAVDAAGTAWHRWSGDFPGGWADWHALGGSLASRAVPVRWADGHVEVFARGKDGRLYHSAYEGGWQPFDVLGVGTVIAGEPSAIVNPKGNGASEGPEVFARDEGGRVVHLWWDGGGWTDWTPLHDMVVASDPFAWIRHDGRAEVFAIDGEGRLVRSYHDPGAGWTPWAPIGGAGNFDPCLPPAPPEGTGGGGPGTGSGTGGDGPSEAGVGGAGGGVAGKSEGPGTLGNAVDEGGAAEEGGCGCRVPAPAGEPSRSTWLALALAGAAFARTRRRAR